MKEKQTYSTSPLYFFEAMRAQGWSSEACIFEFTDNSIDANANFVNLKWNRDKDSKRYHLIVEDNGHGVEGKDLISSFTQLGSEGKYENESIGKFGVGATASIINLLTDGTANIISTTKKTKETSLLPITHTKDNDLPDLEVESQTYTGESGTLISIPNIKSMLQAAQLKRLAGVTYFPNSDRQSKNSNFQMLVNDEKIDFIDPFYRNTNWDEIDGIVRGKRTVNLGQHHQAELQILKFMPHFDEDKLEKYKWDVRKGKGSLSRENSGLYIRVGGRYINLGNRLFPGIYVENTHYRIRFELTVPREIFTEFGIQMNKSKVTLDESNPMLTDLLNVIREECRNLINDMNKYIRKKIPKQAKDFEKAINKEFNLKLNTLSLPALAKGSTGKLIEKRVSNGRNPNGNGVLPVGSGRKRSGNTASKSIKSVQWKLESNGHKNPNYEWRKDSNGTLYITLNIDTAWGKSIPTQKGTLFTKQTLPMCWDIYSWIKVNLEEAACKLKNGDLEGAEKIREAMEDCVDDQTHFLNKVLR